MFSRKGFTLLELIIVIIVIGILASIALPRYLDTVEQAKFGAAKHSLGEIRNQQIAQAAQYGNYSTTLSGLANLAIADTIDWTFTAADSADISKATYLGTADRMTGNYDACKMKITVDGNISEVDEGTCPDKFVP